MNAIVLEKPGCFAAVDRPDPGDPPPGMARVRVHRVGICGTDWHAYHGRQPFLSYPRILGHELGVEIEAVNDPASPLRPGDRCAVEPYLNCGQCIACRRGRGNCCVNMQVMGVHLDGGMQEHILVPARKLHPGGSLAFEQLALVETLAIGRHAVQRAGIEAGEQVLVLGAGPIGLSVLPFVAESGGQAIVADISRQRLAFARQHMNVAHTLEAGDDLPRRLTNLLGDLPTAVIDATGNPASMMRCFDLVAPSGRIVFVGLFQGDVTFNDPNFHRRETTLLATRNALATDFQTIIRLIQQGRIDTTPWITHQADAADFPKVLPDWLAPDSSLLKAVLRF